MRGTPPAGGLDPLRWLLLDLIIDGTRDPARMGLLALLISHNVVPFRAALAVLDYETFGNLSDACTKAEHAAGHSHD